MDQTAKTVTMIEFYDGFVGNPEQNLKCPVCGLEFVHFDRPLYVEGHDNYEADWEGKGDLIVIPMWCENGHLWEMCFGFHKGNTHPIIRNIRHHDEEIEAVIKDAVLKFEHKLRQTLKDRGDMLWPPEPRKTSRLARPGASS